MFIHHRSFLLFQRKWKWICILISIGYLGILAFLQYSIHWNSPIKIEPWLQLDIQSKLTPSWDSSISNLYLSHQLQDSSRNSSQVAILIAYIGNELPSWINMLFFSIINSPKRPQQPTFDWYIVGPDLTNQTIASNLKIIQIPNFYQRIAQLHLLHDQSQSQITLLQLEEDIQELFATNPYILVELKPVLGYLFEDLLIPYSHWAYGDLDMIIGDINSFINHETLTTYDAITFSFGDHYSLYLRGQLTILRKEIELNNLWKQCPHLFYFTTRIIEYYTFNPTSWMFQSAEGCFSKILYQYPKIKILILPSQFSDAFHGNLQEKEVIFNIPNQIIRCFHQPITTNHIKNPISEALTNRTRIHSYYIQANPSHCSYWLNNKYEICTKDVPSQSIIYIYNQTARYQPVVMSSQQMCIEGSFFHFQGWKRRYYPFMTRLPHEPMSSFVLTSTGFIPWKDSSDRLSFKSDNNKLYPPKTYCLQYESNLQQCSCRINTTHIQIINSLKTIDQQFQHQSITMIKTGYYHDLYQLLNHTIDWPYHKLFVIKAKDNFSVNIQDLMNYYQDLTIIQVLIPSCHSESHLSWNSLRNIGLDYTSTSYVYLDMINDWFFPRRDITTNIINIINKNILQSSMKLTPQKAYVFLPNVLQPKHQVLHILGLLFDRTHNTFGNSFIRFPEELNDDNDCFANSIVKLLKSIGHEIISDSLLEIPPSDSYILKHCFTSRLITKNLKQFLFQFDDYLSRIEKLSKFGLEDIYSRSDWAANLGNSPLQSTLQS